MKNKPVVWFCSVLLTAGLAGLLAPGLAVPAQSYAIKHYKRYFAVGSFNHEQVAVIRSYKVLSKKYYIGVGFRDLLTYVIPSDKIKIRSESWKNIMSSHGDTPYIAAVNAARAQSFSLQDAGIHHAYLKDRGVTLTIDLCPSHKSLDRIIFTSLVKEFKNYEKPVPIALSITGRFMNEHPDDLEWLKKMVELGDLKITWIDHTYNHRYDPKLPLPDNFLLERGTNLNSEILKLEKSLLEKGFLFSAFFRFPGLVSDRRLVYKVTSYGLIPIGSDAWLAKGQHAKNGDIVLIHGNGNEPVGVKDFIRLLREKKESVMDKTWTMYDLRESIDQEFKK